MLLYNSQGLLVLITGMLMDHSLLIAFEFNATYFAYIFITLLCEVVFIINFHWKGNSFHLF